MAHGVIIMNCSGDILSANNEIENIFGYSESELINLNINNFIPLSLNEFYMLYIHKNSTQDVCEFKNFTGINKASFKLTLDISIIKFSLGCANYLACLIRNGTPRKVIEQCHIEDMEKISHLSSIEIVMSSVAHEISQPLMVIANYTEACLAFIHSDKNYDPEKMSDILIKTNQQSHKLGQIVHSLRNRWTSRH